MCKLYSLTHWTLWVDLKSCIAFAKLNLEVVRTGELKECLSALAIRPSFFEEILNSQDKDPRLLKLKEQAREGKAE